MSALDKKGIKKAVLSNKPEALTKMCVDKYFEGYKFDFVAGQREGVDIKPNPTIALEIAQSFALKPSEIAIVGDSKNDILTAKNGGFYSIGVTWGFRDREELEESGADAIVDTPQQLLNII